MTDITSLLGLGPDVVEPDLAGWSSVRIGMNRNDVDRLLGPPKFTGEFCGHLICGYGYVSDALMPSGFPFSYSLSFGHNGRVADIIEPFGNSEGEGVGLSAPEVLTPEERRDYAFVPRILDCRWKPERGQHPVQYDIDLFGADERGETGPQMYRGVLTTFISILLPEPGDWCIRLRCRDLVFVSEWSERRHFRFVK